MRRLFPVALFAILSACGGGSAPTTPVVATPAPAPTPTPNPFAAACGSPLPPAQFAAGFGIKVQLEPSRNKKILNASPTIRDVEYCAAVHLFGNFCNTRNEDDPTRVPCDHYISGISITGQPGPNWYQEIDGKLLRCPGDTVSGDAPNCYLKPENQYLLDVYAAGSYKACGSKGSNGKCGVCILDPNEFNKIHASTGGLCDHEGTPLEPPVPE